MSRRFELTMFPALEGDCLLLTYEGDGRLHRVLVDGGRKSTARAVRAVLAKLPKDERVFEALIVTHVDRDHIEGVLSLVGGGCPVTFRDVWFNGYHHLHHGSIERYGARQGELFSTWLQQPGRPWNKAFSQGPVETGTHTVLLAGGLKVTVLSPDRMQLQALIPRWERECAKAGLILGKKPRRDPTPPGLERMGKLDIASLAESPFKSDDKKPNGSTIAVLAEHDGRRVLMGGDAHVARLVSSVHPLAAADGGRLRLDALKVPHHGSAANISKELLALLDCHRYLISTNGAYFGHPDPEAIARIICHGGADPELIFNYRSDQTLLWDVGAWRRKHGYKVTYPPTSRDGTIAVCLTGSDGSLT